MHTVSKPSNNTVYLRVLYYYPRILTGIVLNLCHCTIAWLGYHKAASCGILVESSREQSRADRRNLTGFSCADCLRRTQRNSEVLDERNKVLQNEQWSRFFLFAVFFVTCGIYLVFLLTLAIPNYSIKKDGI